MGQKCSNKHVSVQYCPIPPITESLIHCLILDKARFNPKISKFFSNYLIGRKTQYLWNNFSSFFVEVNVGVEQGSALSPILLALYLSPLFHIFKEYAKRNLKIPVSFVFFVNDSLLVSQEKSLEKTNLLLFCRYNIVFLLLN